MTDFLFLACGDRWIIAPEHVIRLRSAEVMREAGLSPTEVEQFVAEMTHAHFARFPLYSEEERETFLHGLPWGKNVRPRAAADTGE